MRVTVAGIAKPPQKAVTSIFGSKNHIGFTGMRFDALTIGGAASKDAMPAMNDLRGNIKLISPILLCFDDRTDGSTNSGVSVNQTSTRYIDAKLFDFTSDSHIIIDGMQGEHLIVKLCANQIDNLEFAIQKYRKLQEQAA